MSEAGPSTRAVETGTVYASTGAPERSAGPPLGAVVALAGSLRSTALTEAVGRSLLDLPLDTGKSILRHWQEQVSALAKRLARAPLPLRIMINRGGIVPQALPPVAGVEIGTEEDRGPYRGTGGVLRDLMGDYDAQDNLVVINGPQVMLCPLIDVLVPLAQTRAAVAVASYDDGTPSGIMLVRARALAQIPDAGFIDLKEQALPQIALRHRVAVARWASPLSLPIRTLADYIEAVFRYHQAQEGAMQNDAFSEQWRPAFGIVESGAAVHPSARIHDSVVLAGGRVERDAVVVRSVVGPGGVVHAGQAAIERLVRAPANTRREHRP